MASKQTANAAESEELPPNRFELELEFLQSLASPAYIHYLSTSEDDLHALQPFFKYLRKTWTQPDYIRFIQYPDCLYFLDMLIDNPRCLKEWTLLGFRDFCHQQQFWAWQYRHATCYGVGTVAETVEADKIAVSTQAAAAAAGGADQEPVSGEEMKD